MKRLCLVRLQALESERVSDRIRFQSKADLFSQPLYLCDKSPLQNDEGQYQEYLVGQRRSLVYLWYT